MKSRKFPWIRLRDEALDDERIGVLSFEDRWHFIALMCLDHAGILKASDPLMFRKAAVKMDLTVAELSDVADRLAHAGLIDRTTLKPSMHLVATKESLRPVASVWMAIRARIFRRDNYTCQYCGASDVTLECDHIVPVSRGGGHDDENLATACFDCNRSKRDKLLSEWSPA